MLGLRTSLLSDNGAFFADAQPSKFKAGLFHIVTGSYDIPAAHIVADGYYTNKAPGGVAYRCSFRITEAVYLVERMVDALALEMNVDPIDLRMRSFIGPDQFPYETTTGWTYDSGNYAETMKVAMEIAGYEDLMREQREKRERGELMGIGVSFFTEGVGAGPRKHMDILGLAMNDGADLRVHPSGKAVVSISAQTQGQGHETTFAQIVAEELGIQPEDVKVMHGDTDNTPYGLGTYASRSTPVKCAPDFAGDLPLPPQIRRDRIERPLDRVVLEGEAVEADQVVERDVPARLGAVRIGPRRGRDRAARRLPAAGQGSQQRRHPQEPGREPQVRAGQEGRVRLSCVF